MPPQPSKSQALLRVISLMLATVLFIVIAERDGKHDSHQRWLAESRRREAEHRLMAHSPRTPYTSGRHGYISHHRPGRPFAASSPTQPRFSGRSFDSPLR